jgi:hypothetical protein
MIEICVFIRIQLIFDNVTKRDFNQKSNSCETLKRDSMTMSKHLKRRNRTCSRRKIDEKNRINDDN